MKLAPIVLFVYNRLWHTSQTLNALKLNELANKSILYIYCDGAKSNCSEEEIKKINEVRSFVKKESWCREVHIIERNENLGLATNIIEGVTEVINKYGNIIVLEDDIVTSKGFLKYMNDALFFYRNDEEVMHISGYMYPHKEKFSETFFFNVPLCWGWATWNKSWKHFDNNSIGLWCKLQDNNLINDLDKFGKNYLSSQLAQNILGTLNTWFIKWHASVLLKKGITLYPKKSLVNNIGFDNSGVHNGNLKQFEHKFLAESINVKYVTKEENIEVKKIINNFYNELTSNKPVQKQRKIQLKKIIKNKIRVLFFKLFPDIKKSLKINQELINLNRVNKSNTYLGKQCIIYPKARISDSIIGDYSYIAENSIINKTIIGKFCSIGPNLISGWGIHPTKGISTHPMFYSARKQNGMTFSSGDKIKEVLAINIGNDVFIGMNVTILDGIKIGDGAVIGAGAVVSKDIPDYAIAVGNPIKIIKYRFEEKKINKLLRLKWWNFKDEELHLVEEHFFNVCQYLNRLQ